MKFSDLYACSRCARVYAAEVNNGVCRELVSVDKSTMFGDLTSTMCGGTIRPITYKPPEKDPTQRDIEDRYQQPMIRGRSAEDDDHGR